MARTFREQETKQGRSGRRVLIILICGIVLALGAWGVAALLVPKGDAPAETPAPTETLPSAQ
ncbi:hypothetical protein [Aquamicrobium ahrensii]|uniref:Flagellar basal body-associated protein FliL n=1 Tax=Aquamicrobium ahrensii TaxID=469551 RepID=A0ABV2KNT0_9HYPH